MIGIDTFSVAQTKNELKSLLNTHKKIEACS